MRLVFLESSIYLVTAVANFNMLNKSDQRKELRWLPIYALSGLAIAIILLLLVGIACITVIAFVAQPKMNHEVSRITSPDQMVDAVVEEHNPGGLDPFTYNVYVVKPHAKLGMFSKRVARACDATLNRSTNGLNLHWESPSILLVRYWSASHAQIELPTVRINGQDVHVQFQDGFLCPPAKVRDRRSSEPSH